LETVAIALGSNVGDSVALIRQAMGRVESDLNMVSFRSSSLYRTLPVGPVEQGDFINAVCVGQSTMGSDEILFALQNIESDMGRERLIHWGPRTMDLDLLFVGNRVIETPQLVVPHPAMHERGFVLQPLSELALSWVHPILNESIGDLVVRWEANHNSSESVWLLDPERGAS